jgi:CPA2 family monovalent cation:H+ antiporter-2
MSESQFLGQIAILFGTAVAVSWLFRVARAPSIIGFLCTGILIGPSVFGWIESDSVDQFAELGLVLLLFTVGLELSPAPLLRAGRNLLKATITQMVTTGAVAAATVGIVLHQSAGAALLTGLAVALSSTAISLKQLSDRGEVSTVMGSLTTGVLLLQDVIVIAVMVLLPLFTSGRTDAQHGPLYMIGAFAGLAAIVAGGRYLLPTIVGQVQGRGGQELATLFAVMMAGGGAWLSSLAGWSPALGACVAGLLLANADSRHQLVAEITPFRDVFNALFFISVGMLANMDEALNQGGVILAAVGATLVVKIALTAAAARVAGWPARISWRVGLGLCTVSEFAYVLLRQAASAGLVTHDFLQAFVAYLVGTMMAGAMIFPVGLETLERLARRFRPETGLDAESAEPGELELRDHVVVVGYGVTGSNLSRVLRSTHVPFCVIELNQALIRDAQAAGAHVVLGDAARVAILRHAGIGRATALVVAINDPQATRRIVSIARAACPALHIVVRTHYVSELEDLSRRGANVVVPADFEASVRIFSHVLEELGVPRNILAAQIAAVRAGGYGVFRGRSSGSQESLEDLLKVLQISATQTFFLPDTSLACNRTLRELDLRNRTGATLIAVVRDRKPVTNPEADFRLQANDVLVLVGAHVQLTEARKLLDASSQLDASPPSGH